MENAQGKKLMKHGYIFERSQAGIKHLRGLEIDRSIEVQARGTYPENLTELVPEFVEAEPRDVYAHAPYRYQRLKEKSFRLYGVGDNRRDDGGALDHGKSETRQPDDVWLYAPGEGSRR